MNSRNGRSLHVRPSEQRYARPTAAVEEDTSAPCFPPPADQTQAVKNLQFTSTARLDPMIMVLPAVAVTLLNLRAASRREDATTRPATDVVSIEYVQVLGGWRYKTVRDDLTVWEFFYALARLGGHQNRKHDKRPGWFVLRCGWTTLQAMLDGAEAIRRKRCATTRAGPTLQFAQPILTRRLNLCRKRIVVP